jgi:energy-coupling factor transporter ATP-binding protein EcfA2
MSKSKSNSQNTISQQKIQKIYFKKLKNLRDVEIDFEPHFLTAILGPNGHGKSTILHALACCYQPLLNNPVSKDYKHNQFFPPTSDSTWTDSNFTLYHSYRDGEETINTHLHYSKKRQWKPGYGSRPSRYVYFIGIETCVPDIEKEKQKTIIKYDKTNLSEEIYSQIKNKASYIMNREYVEYHNLVTNKNKKYKGVKYSEYSYSSLIWEQESKEFSLF